MIKQDILSYSSRHFPRKLHDPNSDTTVNVYFDVVEFPALDDLHWAKITQAHPNIRYSTPTTKCLETLSVKAMPFNASAWFDDVSYWIIVNGKVLTALGWFSGMVFQDPAFRSALKFQNLTEVQVQLVEAATVRMALEIAMAHEYGHIACGHARSETRNVGKFVTKVAPNELTPLGTDHKQSSLNWRKALELAADDFAAINLGMRSHFRQFWTFPFEEDLLKAGEQAPTICMMLGFITYFFLDSVFNEEEAPHYPKLDERVRYFYMTLSDTMANLETQPKRPGTIDLSLFSAALLVKSAFEQYASSEGSKDVQRILEALSWIDNDDKELEVMSRVKKNYGYYTTVDPYYKGLKYESFHA